MHILATSPWVGLALPFALGLLSLLPGRSVKYLAACLLTVYGVVQFIHATRDFGHAYVALVDILGAFAFWRSPDYLEGARRLHHWSSVETLLFYPLLGLFLTTCTAIGQPWSLTLLWVAIEATTLVSVALVALHPSPRPLKAAWQYLLLAGFGGLLALAGILLLAVGTPAAATSAVVLLLVGLGTKAGLAPFHTWLPDAHAEAPAPVSALLSGAELAGVLLVLARALATAEHQLAGARWPSWALLTLALTSLTVGVVMLPLQTNLKRLFAFSSIEHMGVIALGFAFGGVGTLGALLHVLTHGLAKAEAFYVSGDVEQAFHTLRLRQITDVGRRIPWAASGLAVAGLSLAGFPPFGPFWSEWTVLLGGFEAKDMFWPALFAALLLAGGAFAMAAQLPKLWRSDAEEAVHKTRLSPSLSLSTVVLSLLTFGAGVGVPWFLHWPI